MLLPLAQINPVPLDVRPALKNVLTEFYGQPGVVRPQIPGRATTTHAYRQTFVDAAAVVIWSLNFAIDSVALFDVVWNLPAAAAVLHHFQGPAVLGNDQLAPPVGQSWGAAIGTASLAEQALRANNQRTLTDDIVDLAMRLVDETVLSCV
jgi:hypothetical protein